MPKIGWVSGDRKKVNSDSHYNKNNHCKCGKLILNNSKHCHQCATKNAWNEGIFKNRNFKGKNHPNYIDGRTLKKHYCIDCLKKGVKTEISYATAYFGGKRCQICEDKHHSRIMRGKLNVRYNTERHKKHYCIECLKKGIKTEISYNTWKYGEKRCRKCAKKLRWKDAKYKEKMLKAQRKGVKASPNVPEKILLLLLNTLFPNDYKFVGDGKVILGGFNPDFINCNGQKKIVELYGDYWHNRPDLKKRDKRRLQEYAKLGYKTLIVWEKELKNIDKLKNRLVKFNGVKNE
jgi:very-short-patch-repair endonuclease